MFRVSRFLGIRYDVTCILSSKAPLLEVQTCMKGVATNFLNKNGVIYDIVNRGEMDLAYSFKKHFVKHDTGRFFVMDIESSKPALDALMADLKREEIVLRTMALKNTESRPITKRKLDRPRKLPSLYY